MRLAPRSRLRVLAATILVVALALVGFARVPRANGSVNWSVATWYEVEMVKQINHYRNAHGLRSLHIHTELERKAHNVVQWTIAGGCGRSGGIPKICHSNLTLDIHSRWHWLGENVGMVGGHGNFSGMQAAFARSAPHREIMLNRSANFVGVGIANWGPYMYVVEEFMAA